MRAAPRVAPEVVLPSRDELARRVQLPCRNSAHFEGISGRTRTGRERGWRWSVTSRSPVLEVDDEYAPMHPCTARSSDRDQPLVRSGIECCISRGELVMSERSRAMARHRRGIAGPPPWGSRWGSDADHEWRRSRSRASTTGRSMGTGPLSGSGRSCPSLQFSPSRQTRAHGWHTSCRNVGCLPQS
jgi:hypothetical protein